MPVIYKCHQCGCILWTQGQKIQAAVSGPWSNLIIPTPQEVMAHHQGRCPKCGRHLTFHPERIQVGVPVEA